MEQNRILRRFLLGSCVAFLLAGLFVLMVITKVISLDSPTGSDLFSRVLKGAFAAALVYFSALSIHGYTLERKAPSPSFSRILPLAAIGTCAGFVGGVGLHLVLTAMTPHRLSGTGFLLIMETILVFAGSVVSSAYAMYRVESRVLTRHAGSTPAFRTWNLAIGAVYLASLFFLVSSVRSTFPGNSAGVEERNAWAERNFSGYYLAVVAYIKSSRAIREQLGDVSAVAPLAGVNKIDEYFWDDDGEFVLQVRGALDEGVFKLKFIYASGCYDVHGILSAKGREIPVDENCWKQK